MKNIVVNFEDLEKYNSTISEVSLDDTNTVSMIESDISIISFDRLKTDYTIQFNSRDNMKSADGLFLENSTFVEFKNGKLIKNQKGKWIDDKYEIQEIELKIKDSVLIFCDIAKKNLEYIRENFNFILVYNFEKNALDRFTDNLFRNSKKEIVRFGMNKHKNIIFRDVHTYTEEEFKEYLNKNFKNKN